MCNTELLRLNVRIDSYPSISHLISPSPPLSGVSPGVSGAPAGEAEGDGGAESRHDHPGSRHGLHGQVRPLRTPQKHQTPS